MIAHGRASLANLMKRAVKRAMVTGPGWRLASGMLMRRSVTVLMYHSVGGRCAGALEPAQFEAQMAWLAAHCTIVDPDGFEPRGSAGPVSRPQVMLTFDDGYRDYHDVAYPVIRRYGFRALVFLATAFQDDGGMIWTDELAALVSRASAQSLTLPWAPDRTLPLGSDDERRVATDVLKDALKRMPDRDRKDGIRLVSSRLDPGTRPADRQMLSWDEVRATSDHTCWGGHTHSHPIMSRLPTHELRHEVRLCRDRILDETGRRPIHFAYTNGQRQDFNDAAKRILQEEGFEMAFSTIPGRHCWGDDVYEIRRQPTRASTVADFACLVLGRNP